MTYFAPDVNAKVINIGKESIHKTISPATYLEEVPSSVDEFESTRARLLAEDDVQSDSYFSTIIFPTTNSIPKEVDLYLRSKNINIIVATFNKGLPSGPYFLHPSGDLTQVYRLYVDYNMAFTQGVVKNQDGQYIPCIAAAGENVHAAISIPVPSRHYFPRPSLERPLSGMRLAVKDIFDIKGLKTGAGSRAYFELYAAANKTAPSMQRLIDLGAVIVGKVKAAQFATGEIPTADYVDQFAPFNPRGDGYQSPSASSCGTAAAIASYDWLDLGAGSDTGGSIRMPCALNGLFGMRISNASLPLDGIVPVTAKMDTPGLITRDAKLLQTAYNNWFVPRANYSSFPKRILLPEEFWPVPNRTSMPVFDNFIKSLSRLTDAKVEFVNTNQSFIQHTGYRNGLEDFITSFNSILLLDQWENLGRPFILDYQRKFGRYPFVNPLPRFGLSLVPNIDLEVYEEATQRLQLYKDWFNSKIVTSCNDAILIYPIGPGLEQYRDESLNSPPGPITTHIQLVQASAAGLPDYTVPIGTREYDSKVSLRKEKLPVSVGIVGGAGCDNLLLDLVVKLGEKIPEFKTSVNTGRHMY